MSDKLKNSFKVIAAVIVAILLLWFLLRTKQGQQIAQQANNVVSALPLAFSVPAPASYVSNEPDVAPYTPHDFSLPLLGGTSLYLNTGCNFCSKVTAQVAPPSPPVAMTYQQTVSPTYYAPQPFGGSGA